MGPIVLDENGHIEINDSMSDELKAKIAQYNSFSDEASVEDETLTDEEVEAISSNVPEDFGFYEESTDEDTSEVESLEPEEPSVSDEDLNNLNNLFM